DLYSIRIGNEAARVLAESPLAARLEKIRFSDGEPENPFDAEGVRVLTSKPVFPRLRILELDNANVGDTGARLIARAPHFVGLTELWLHYCEIRDPGVKALAGSPHLANLEVLDLSTNWTVGHAGAVALSHSPYLKKIRYLDVWRCEGMTPS